MKAYFMIMRSANFKVGITMKKFWKWLENYWYHYKWVTIVAIFVAVLVVVGVSQMINKEDADVRMVYFGPAAVSGEQASDIEFAFEQMMKYDYNGDGTKTVQITVLNYYTEELYAEKMKESEEKGTFFAYDPSNASDTISQLNTLIGSGDTVICLLDDSMYADLKEQGAFETLETVLGYKPEKALDDYSVYLGDTGLVQSYSAFAAIPDNTRLCICKLSQNTYLIKKNAVSKAYDRHLEMFRDIFAYTKEGKEEK